MLFTIIVKEEEGKRKKEKEKTKREQVGDIIIEFSKGHYRLYYWPT